MNELLDIRSQLISALGIVDRLLTMDGSMQDPNTLLYRVRPGGPLNDTGSAEITRRFAAGETDGVIARNMGISVQGVANRRTSWVATKN